MTVTITRLEAVPLTARFADIYGGADSVPPEITRPSSHFQAIPRRGQSSTFVFLEASDGAGGYGECFGLPTPEPAAEIVNRVIGEALIGRPLIDPAAMTADLRRYFLALGHSRGPAMEALSGVDIALWDLCARRAGRPLASFLGGQTRWLPTYVSPVPFLATPQASAAAARALIGNATGLKLKVGRGAQEDLPHVAAVRDAIGNDVALMLDANCGYSREDAAVMAREVEQFGIRWLEEPLPPEDVEGLATLARTAKVPLAGGENEFTHEGLARLAAASGISILQPNVSRIGGITGLLAAGAYASDAARTIAPHGVGGCIVLAATLHAASAIAAFDVFEVNRLPNPLRDDLGNPCQYGADGSVRPPEGPGHGSPVDRDVAHPFEPALAVVHS